MRQFLIMFETKFLIGLRWLFTIVVILMLIGLVGSIAWFASQQLRGPSDDPIDYLQAPIWDELRFEVLSIPPLQPQPLGIDSKQIQEGTTIEVEVDPNIVEAVEVLDSMYARDPSWSFSNSINATRLASWLSTAISLSEEERRLFNQSLLVYGKTLATDPLLDRLAINQERLETLTKAIDVYVSSYTDQHINAQQRAAEAEAQAQLMFATNLLIVMAIVGTCFGVLLVLALFIVLMRAEDHLSRIALRDGD